MTEPAYEEAHPEPTIVTDEPKLSPADMSHMASYLTHVAKEESFDMAVRKKAKAAAKHVAWIVATLQKQELDQLEI